MLWDCEHCGCKQIAGSVTLCPMCSSPRPEPPAGEPTPAEEGTPAEEDEGATSGSQESEAPQASPVETTSSEVPSSGGFLVDGNWA